MPGIVLLLISDYLSNVIHPRAGRTAVAVIVATTIAGLVVLGFGFWRNTVHLIGRQL